MADPELSPLEPLPAEAWGDEEYTAFGALIGTPGDKVPRAGSGKPADPTRFPVVGLLVRHPDLAGRLLALNGYLMQRGALPARVRELAILRVAYVRQSPYLWAEHVEIATKASLTSDEVTQLVLGNKEFSGTDRVTLDATDEMLVSGRMTPSTWATVVDDVGIHGAIELIFVVGTWTMLATAFNTWELAPRPESAPLPAPTA